MKSNQMNYTRILRQMKLDQMNYYLRQMKRDQMIYYLKQMKSNQMNYYLRQMNKWPDDEKNLLIYPWNKSLLLLYLLNRYCFKKRGWFFFSIYVVCYSMLLQN